jgi:hypothetical protein
MKETSHSTPANIQFPCVEERAHNKAAKGEIEDEYWHWARVCTLIIAAELPTRYECWWHEPPDVESQIIDTLFLEQSQLHDMHLWFINFLSVLCLGHLNPQNMSRPIITLALPPRCQLCGVPPFSKLWDICTTTYHRPLITINIHNIGVSGP